MSLYEHRYQQWLTSKLIDQSTRRELLALAGDREAIRERFHSELEFGTGGMRGILGAGLNRMNCYVVRRVTQGLANLVNSRPGRSGEIRVAIAYDTRRCSREFAQETALVLAANGIKALLFDTFCPTPVLSFVIRELGCAAGVVITASHNPSQYNGYKVYGPDGGQAVSPLVDELTEAIRVVDIFEGVAHISRQEAEKRGLLELIGSDLDRRYLEKVRALSLTSPQAELKVVYTPLHGTGSRLIPQLLEGTGFVKLAVVEEQALPDHDFPTVKVPNPEEESSLAMALDLARRHGADLVMATDPDGDRIGCAVRQSSGGYLFLSGNQVGALLLEYLLGRLKEREALPANGVIVQTIVSGELSKKVASYYGVETVETLTGFKYIGEKIKEFEEEGRRLFLFGYEESCGYLVGSFVRDKDAVIASFLIAEMAAFYKEKGKTLADLLAELYCRHGYYREELISLQLKDLAAAERFIAAFDRHPPAVCELEPVEKRDYRQGRRWNLITGESDLLSLPRAPVLYYRYPDGSWFCVRPSGTEPKIKIYFSVTAASELQAAEKLDCLKKGVRSTLDT